MDSLRDRFAWSYNRHCRCWKWRERRPADDAEELGHVTKGEAQSKGLALAQIRMELQRRKELLDAPDDASASDVATP